MVAALVIHRAGHLGAQEEGAELHGPAGAETNTALAPTQSCQGPEGGPEGAAELHGPEGAELEDDDQPMKRRRHA